jgi:hypothetical protein
LLGDRGWEELAHVRADDDVRRVREAREITPELEVCAVCAEPQQQVRHGLDQGTVPCLDRCGDPIHDSHGNGGLGEFRVRERCQRSGAQ